MIKKYILSVLLSLGAIFSASAASRFEPGKGTFMLDGKPFTIKAAELHYPRIPKPYWEHRIQMCKALGMNTICLYVFWNLHEQKPGEYDFTGDKDLAEFIRLCQANGMYVILRPGPYVCAEWEMGGLPWWLLKTPDIRLREDDPRFLERVRLFEQEVARQVADLSIDKGGPILMVQVENEYGSYGKNKPYVSAIRDIVREGWGEDMTLFQCDWASNFLDNGLDDLTWTMNFGTGTDVDSQFAKLREVRPDSPLMCSEYWSGWFDKWGAEHETRPAEDMTAGIDEMLSKGISFSLYMTHGGTNRGHWAGANSPGYAPDVTSYDYDAPIDEQGRPTDKYHLLRATMQRHNSGAELPEVPEPIPVMSIDGFTLTEVAPIADNLPVAIADSVLRPMEMYDQGFGSIMYRLAATEDMPTYGWLSTGELRDFGIVYLNGERIGSIDRRKGEQSVDMPPVQKGDTIDIFVEATGRINFGRAIKDYKGLTGEVYLENLSSKQLLHPTGTYLFPDEYSAYQASEFRHIDEAATYKPGVYRGTFTLPAGSKPADTFLDFSTWGKGLVYVNGHPLGRIWSIGPQQTIYTPGVWLKPGDNEILVFDVTGPQLPYVQGLETPVNDRLQIPTQLLFITGVPDEATLIADVELPADEGWQTIRLDKPADGTQLYIIAENEEDFVAIAELFAANADGRLSREQWTAIGASSSERKGNHTPEKVFDQQESTYWQSNSMGGSHILLIDLGEQSTISALELLPRTEKGAPGQPRKLKIFIL